MKNVRLIKFKFKPDKKQVWLDWAKELESRKTEVLNSLKKEGVTSECCFMSDDGEHVYYFMESEDLKKADGMTEKEPRKIDRDHKYAREESLEFVEKLDCLFSFTDSIK